MHKTQHVHAGDLPTPDLFFQRASTYQCELSRAPLLRQSVPSSEQLAQVFLSRDASDVCDQEIAGTEAECLTVGLTSEPGMKLVRIDTATPDTGMSDTTTVKVLLVNAGGAENPVGLAIKPAQVMPADPQRPVDPVAGRVLVVVGVGRRENRKLELTRGLQTSQTEGELGGHMDHIGTEAAHILRHVTQ